MIKEAIGFGNTIEEAKEKRLQLEKANKQNIPIVNYGVCLALTSGILERSLKPFKIK